MRDPLFRQDEDEEKVFYLDNPELIKSSGIVDTYNLPSEIKHAYVGHALHEAIMLKFPAEKESYRVDFQWFRMKRSFLNSSRPVFFDLGPTYLLYVTKHNFKNHFEGLIITRQRFLKKYRKRKPDSL